MDDAGAGTMRFSFEGQTVSAQPGQSVAAALTAAGHRALRHTASGGRRGMFCGMGVCQDCLVTIDGAPGRRACMTPARAGMVVTAQAAFPPLQSAPAAPAPPARRIAPDVLVLGGGAGGLSAAIAAAGAGASVVVLDERKVAGGQYYKQTAGDAPPLDAQQRNGRALLDVAARAGVEIVAGAEVWGAFDGLLFLAAVEGGALIARPRTAIVATGAYERPALVPGWTLPGVMTTGAAQTLWRSYRTLPGARVALFGSGPLNFQVAQELARGGARVVLVAEAGPAPASRPGAVLGLVAAGPRLAAMGARMVAGLRLSGVKLRYGSELVAVREAAGGLVAEWRDASGALHQVEADAICLNEGFEPQNEILRLLGAAMEYDAAFGHLRCGRGTDMQTSVPGLFAVGDCAGLGGAPAAVVEGRIAGRAAAALVRGQPPVEDRALATELARHRRFQTRLWALHRPAPRKLEDAPGETVICRCEEVTLADVRAAAGAPAGHLGTLKRATRLGMGRCQGRYCGAAAARLLAAAGGPPMRDDSLFAPRVPIKPVAIAAIVAAQEALDGEG